MTTNPPTTIHIPKQGGRCIDALAEPLRGYRVIEKVKFDLENGQLKAVYDPRILSNENAMQVIRQSGQTAAGCRCLRQLRRSLSPGCIFLHVVMKTI